MTEKHGSPNGFPPAHQERLEQGREAGKSFFKKDSPSSSSSSKNTLIVGVGTLISRLLGFVRDASIAWLLGGSGAADALTALFDFNIPQRWSVAHLYQAILNHEPHVKDIAYLTTLAGYVHWKLTGRKVLGVGDASGMFPIDSATGGYDARMLAAFAPLAREAGMPWTLDAILPEPLVAGDDAGTLTAEGARLLDTEGDLLPGVPLCPPEGDAGTGMAATNSVAERTGNVSAGTSIFSMVVLE